MHGSGRTLTRCRWAWRQLGRGTTRRRGRPTIPRWPALSLFFQRRRSRRRAGHGELRVPSSLCEAPSGVVMHSRDFAVCAQHPKHLRRCKMTAPENGASRRCRITTTLYCGRSAMTRHFHKFSAGRRQLFRSCIPSQAVRFSHSVKILSTMITWPPTAENPAVCLSRSRQARSGVSHWTTPPIPRTHSIERSS